MSAHDSWKSISGFLNVFATETDKLNQIYMYVDIIGAYTCTCADRVNFSNGKGCPNR